MIFQFGVQRSPISPVETRSLEFPGDIRSKLTTASCSEHSIREVISLAARKHLMAVNRAIRAANLDELGIDAPLAELLRDLARQMDKAGEDGPPTRLLASYLSATKDLRRAISPRSARARSVVEVEEPGGDPDSPRALTLVKESPLDQIRKNKSRAHG
ncbi:MAG: hypothetical protein ACOH14_06375 [Rhodoglobus sp.]